MTDKGGLVGSTFGGAMGLTFDSRFVVEFETNKLLDEFREPGSGWNFQKEILPCALFQFLEVRGALYGFEYTSMDNF